VSKFPSRYITRTKNIRIVSSNNKITKQQQRHGAGFDISRHPEPHLDAPLAKVEVSKRGRGE